MSCESSDGEQWRKAVPIGYVMNGSGTSPAIAGDTIVLNCDQDEGESFLLAVEAHTGTTRWQKSRAGSIGSYTTPILWRRGTHHHAARSPPFGQENLWK